jgi:dTMP kinase
MSGRGELDGIDREGAGRRGRLIAIEGIDGTGKSTLAAALGEALCARGVAVVVGSEPTKGEYGLKVRALASGGREGVTAEEEAELFLRDREEHVRGIIGPGLAMGRTVILDRYYFSTIAYQGARGVDCGAVERANLRIAPPPDLLVILELPVAEALERIREKRGDEPDHFEGADYLEKVKRIFDAVEHPNLFRLDARQTTKAMVAAVMERLGEA